MPRRIPFLALAVVVAACTSAASGAKDMYRSAREAPPDTTTTTTEPDAEPGALAPLTGLPVGDPDLLDRRVVAVKIDNHPSARPQSGIQEADAMVELLVEGGFTRFIALFHSRDSDYVGPIRSLRPNDPPVVAALGATLAISGGQPWIQSIAVAHGVGLVGEGQGMFRIQGRPGPHDLYGSTLGLRDAADGGGHPDGPPVPWLTIAEWQPTEQVASTVTIQWSVGDTVEWRFDGDDGAYRRWQNGVAHDWIDGDGDSGQIEADVLVFLGAAFFIASPPSGMEGTPVPSIDPVGEGPAWVFSAGRAWVGTWQRDLPTDPFTLRGADGESAAVPAGRPWVSFIPAALTVEFG